MGKGTTHVAESQSLILGAAGFRCHSARVLSDPSKGMQQLRRSWTIFDIFEWGLK